MILDVEIDIDIFIDVDITMDIDKVVLNSTFKNIIEKVNFLKYF